MERRAKVKPSKASNAFVFVLASLFIIGLWMVFLNKSDLRDLHQKTRDLQHIEERIYEVNAEILETLKREYSHRAIATPDEVTGDQF